MRESVLAIRKGVEKPAHGAELAETCGLELEKLHRPTAKTDGSAMRAMSAGEVVEPRRSQHRVGNALGVSGCLGFDERRARSRRGNAAGA
ncbi:hypothetical protein MRX96_011028 [Rhipicephalus microplus]